MDWLTPEIIHTLLAGGLGVFGAIVGGACAYWGSYRLQRHAAKAKRNRISFAIFAGLLAVQQFLNKLLEDKGHTPHQKIEKISETDFYCRVFEENLGNLGTLGAGESVFLYDVYKELKILYGKCSSAIEQAKLKNAEETVPGVSYAISNEFAHSTLREVEGVLDEITILIEMIAIQHGFETVSMQDLADSGVSLPADSIAAGENN